MSLREPLLRGQAEHAGRFTTLSPPGKTAVNLAVGQRAKFQAESALAADYRIIEPCRPRNDLQL
jgi:hypothetical protein